MQANNDTFAALLDPPAGAGVECVSALARRYLEARAKVEEAKKVLSLAGKAEADCEESLLRKLDEAGMKSIRLDSGQLLTATDKTDYKLPGDGDPAREKIIAWMMAEGGESLIKPTVAWQSFNGWCHERVKEDRPIHEAVQAFQRRGVQVRKN